MYKIAYMAIALVMAIPSSYSQTISIGIRATPLKLAEAKVVNSSAANIYGTKNSSFEGEVYVSKYFSGKWGLKGGFNMGMVPWDLYVEGPREVFGTGKGMGILKNNMSIESYVYNSLSLSLLYKVKVKRSFLELSIGSSFRYYNQEDDPAGIGFALNRDAPYDPDDPSQGPPDVFALIPPIGNKLHLSFPISVNYAIIFSPRSILLFGITKNVSLQPIEKGALSVITYGKTYNGEFSPRTTFWGLNVQFQYSIKK